MNRIIVVGSINMDIVNHVRDFPQPGETISGKGTEYHPGGKGANQAVAAAKSGGDVMFIGAVGTDGFGLQLRDHLKVQGVSTDRMAVKEGLTGMAFITVNAGGENQIILSEGSNGKLHASDLPEDILKEADKVLLQNEIPWETNLHVLRVCKSSGIKVVYNPAPARAIPNEYLPLVDTLVLNETEAEVLTEIVVSDQESALRAARFLINKGVRSVIVTMGRQGSLYVDDEEEEIYTPALKVTAVDTTAAGDTFIGAFVAASIKEQNTRTALLFGSAAASITVTRYGAQLSIPTYEETKDVLERYNEV